MLNRGLPPKVIETSRLRLRPWDGDDAAAALQIFTAPAVARWVSGEREALRSATRLRAQLVRWGDETRTSAAAVGHWAIADRSSTAVVGSASLQYDPQGGRELVIGWALAPGSWGRGYATEAGAALARWALHDGGALEVFAILQPGNVRAFATAERIGMQWVSDLERRPDRTYRVYRIRHADLGTEEEA